jgi:hypothetical protein
VVLLDMKDKMDPIWQPFIGFLHFSIETRHTNFPRRADLLLGRLSSARAEHAAMRTGAGSLPTATPTSL